jgi:hypothetical protein
MKVHHTKGSIIMAWYSLIAGYPTKVHYFNYDDDLIMQNTESAICGPAGFGLDIEKVSDPSTNDMCRRCCSKLAAGNGDLEGKQKVAKG